ncbi:MAG: site-specific integrase [Lachnospiraceae bacterium]|nr:site-specific integrase [Lachnospiraceae bacterium]MDD4247910.1 site-specific integrase [Methanosarcina sp.]
MKYPKLQYTKDPEALHLYVRDIRIFTQKEYEIFKNCIKMESHKAIFDILLITGMRYAEMLRLYDHREWYNEKRNIIHLPEEAQKKHKRRQLERTIHPLPSMFNYMLKDFWESRRPPLESTWNKNMQRWAQEARISPYGLSVKTSRKTIESWSIVAGLVESTVCLRQGHDSLTSMRHYQGLAFSDDEQRDIKKQLTAWGMLK